MVLMLALLDPENVLSSIPGQGISVWHLHIVPVPTWILSRYFGFLPQSKNMQTECQVNWSL